MTGLPSILVDARYTPHRRGGDRCRYQLAAQLRQRSTNDYSFLIYDHATPLLGRLESVVTKHSPSEHPGADIFEHWTLPRIGRRRGFDLYHGTFQVLPVRRAARKQVVTIHDLATFEFPEAYGRKFAVYMRWLIGRAVRSADAIIAVSDATRREIIKWFPAVEAKITTVLNGVEEKFFQPASAPPSIELPKSYILFVGNLERKKNLPRLIEAYSRLRRGGDVSAELVIVGSRPDNLPAVKLVSMAGVHFTGYVDDAALPAVYQGAAAVAYPSLYEGFGMPVLEGMAAGVPVLTSSVSSLPEVAGDAAWLVDPTDVDDIARGLRQVLTNHDWRRSAIEAGLRRARALSWPTHATAVEAVYARTLSQ